VALRDKLRQRVARDLESGEEVQAIFLAQTGPTPYLFLLTWLLMFVSRYYVVAVTNRRILVFDATALRPTFPRGLSAVYPRDVRLSGGRGLWRPIELGGKRYRVHARFGKDLEAADAALAAAG
jgi:hypothetical protein